MTDLPVDWSSGDVLEAADINKLIATRTGNIDPIDDATRNYASTSGILGSSAYVWAQINVDNIRVDGNVISSTDTNGDITMTPDGTGKLKTDNLAFDGNTISSTDTNGDIDITPDGTGNIDLNTDLVSITETNALLGVGTSAALRSIHCLSSTSSVEQIWELGDGSADYKKFNLVVNNGGAGNPITATFRILNDAASASSQDLITLNNTGSIEAGTYYNNTLSASSATGTQNSFVITNNSSVVRITNAITLNGITAGTTGQLLHLIFGNASTVNDNSGSAAAGNKIFTKTRAAVTPGAVTGMTFIYDATSSGWVEV